MSEVVLGLVIGALLAFHAYQANQWAKERRSLLHRVIAKNTGEMLVLDREMPKAPRLVEPAYPDGYENQSGL